MSDDEDSFGSPLSVLRARSLPKQQRRPDRRHRGLLCDQVWSEGTAVEKQPRRKGRVGDGGAYPLIGDLDWLLWLIIYASAVGVVISESSFLLRYQVALRSVGANRALELLEGPHALVLIQFPVTGAALAVSGRRPLFDLDRWGIALIGAAVIAFALPVLQRRFRLRPYLIGLLLTTGIALCSPAFGGWSGALLIICSVPYELRISQALWAFMAASQVDPMDDGNVRRLVATLLGTVMMTGLLVTLSSTDPPLPLFFALLGAFVVLAALAPRWETCPRLIMSPFRALANGRLYAWLFSRSLSHLTCLSED